MNINKLLLTGNLVADPELTNTKNGKSLVKVALAKHGKKGQELFIEGEIRQERWTDKQGANHSRLVVRVDSWQFTQYQKRA